MSAKSRRPHGGRARRRHGGPPRACTAVPRRASRAPLPPPRRAGGAATPVRAPRFPVRHRSGACVRRPPGAARPGRDRCSRQGPRGARRTPGLRAVRRSARRGRTSVPRPGPAARLSSAKSPSRRADQSSIAHGTNWAQVVGVKVRRGPIPVRHPLQNCEGCDRGFRGPERGRCPGCRGELAGSAFTVHSATTTLVA